MGGFLNRLCLCLSYWQSFFYVYMPVCFVSLDWILVSPFTSHGIWWGCLPWGTIPCQKKWFIFDILHPVCQKKGYGSHKKKRDLHILLKCKKKKKSKGGNWHGTVYLSIVLSISLKKDHMSVEATVSTYHFFATACLNLLWETSSRSL